MVGTNLEYDAMSEDQLHGAINEHRDWSKGNRFFCSGCQLCHFQRRSVGTNCDFRDRPDEEDEDRPGEEDEEPSTTNDGDDISAIILPKPHPRFTSARQLTGYP